jgi:hypothetical protein
MSVRTLGFNAIHSVIKKDVSQSSSCRQWACQKWHILFFDIFQPESFIEIAPEINGREPILSTNFYMTANVQENVILHNKTFYFGKICDET